MQKTDSSFSLDPTNFPSLDFLIDGGKTATNKRDVKITYSSSRDDVSEISISQGASCNENVWAEATVHPAFTLTGDDGVKQISMMVKTPYGFKSPCITKKISLDTIGPKILAVSGPTDKNYAVGETIEFEANLSEVGTIVGIPKLAFKFGSSSRTADYLSGNGTSKFKFKYIINTDDEGEAGIEILSTFDIPVGSGIYDGLSNASTGGGIGSMFANSRLWVPVTPEPNSVYIASFDKSVTQGIGEVERFFTVAISNVQPVDVTVNYAFVTTSMATNPTDHNLPTTGSVVIPANSRSVKIPFKTFGDSQAIKEKTLGLQLSSTNNSKIKAVGRIQSAVGRIQSVF